MANKLAEKNDKKTVKELVENLTNKSNDIQSDCIKVLYEIGERKPSLLAEYAKEFVALLKSKNNRMQWGCMTVLNTITLENPKLIFSQLPKIIAATDKGSVITRDQAVYILIKLCSVKQYAAYAFALLIKQLKSCPSNQLPMYAENSISIINNKNKTDFIKTLIGRLADIEKDTKRKRVEKVIKRVSII